MQRLAYSIKGLANWILDYASSGGVHPTNMGINKLTFFAVEEFLTNHAILLTNAKIEAWEHGPVFRELYQSFKEYGNGPIKGRALRFSAEIGGFEEARITMPASQAKTLEAVLRPLIHKSAAELRTLSHQTGGAWYRVWWYEGHANPGMEITPALMLEVKARR